MMTEPVGLASELSTLAALALQWSVALYETIKSFSPHPKLVRDLLGEIDALINVLGPLNDTIKTTAGPGLSYLKLPLKRCGDACNHFEQELVAYLSRSGGDRTNFRDWARLRYMGDDIDGFRQLLAGYKLTINIALADASLRQSSATTETLESHKVLIETAKDDFEAHLENIDNKLKRIMEQAATETSSDPSELSLMNEDRLSTEKCLLMCTRLSEHIEKLQLSSTRSITNESIQEFKENLAQTAANLANSMRDLMGELSTMSATSEDDSRLAERFNHLGNELENQYYRLGNMNKLAEGIQVTRQAVEATPKDHPDFAIYLNNLGNKLEAYYNQTGMMESLEEAIQLTRQAVEVTPEDHHDFAIYLNNLGKKLRSYYNQTGMMESLEDAIRVTRKAVEITPEDHPVLAIYLNNLGNSLDHRYERTGKMEDLEEAMQVTRQAIKVTPRGHPILASWLNSLGNKLKSRHERTGQIDDLKEAIKVTRQAIELTPTDYPNLAIYVSSLGDKLESKYVQTGMMENLDEAIQVTRRAVAITSKDHPDLIERLNNLGNNLNHRYERTRQMDDLKESIRVTQQVVELTPEVHPKFAEFNLLRNKLEGQYEQARKIESIKTTLNSEDTDNLDLQSDVVHNEQLLSGFLKSEDSDSAIDNDNDSVFSAAISNSSTRSLDSERNEINLLLIRQFAAMFYEDAVLLSLLSVGISKQQIGFQKMRTKFRHLLKQFATDLKVNILNRLHRDLIRFVNTYSNKVAHEVFAMVPIDEQRNSKLPVSETEIPMESFENRPIHDRKVESYLQNLHKDRPASQSSVGIEVSNLDGEESDQDSTTEEAGEVEPYDGSLQHLDELKHFILRSTAYQLLRCRVEGFVRPSLYSRLRELVTKWSSSEDKNHVDVARYKLRNLVTELQDVDPYHIKFDCDQDISRFVKFISHYQHLVEHWTGEPWDWWPLPRCRRPLGESETRLTWKCACGEERWTELPKAFARRIQSIIRNLPMDVVATQNVQYPPVAHTGSNSLSRSTLNDSQIYNNASHSSHANQQSDGWSSDPSRHHRIPAIKANTFDMSIAKHHVLFLAKNGDDYRLAQICVGDMNCNSFFITLKEEYFRLRGVLRGRFSVWRYSHCDFYKFEKFDDHEFAPKVKDAFPDHANTDYEYQPRPMDNIPPVSQHEFTKRFYACHTPRSLLHLHHKCKSLKGHSSDVLKKLPKKRNKLEEAGDKREDFWGIYARETISARWIIFYNFVCISPLLAFFMAWIIPQGNGTDLQDPSIPLSIMASMLSLFWSVFLGSLQFGKSH